MLVDLVWLRMCEADFVKKRLAIIFLTFRSRNYLSLKLDALRRNFLDRDLFSKADLHKLFIMPM